MVYFTLEERVFMVECHILTQSPNEVIRRFRERFPHRNTPTEVTVLKTTKVPPIWNQLQQEQGKFRSSPHNKNSRERATSPYFGN